MGPKCVKYFARKIESGFIFNIGFRNKYHECV